MFEKERIEEETRKVVSEESCKTMPTNNLLSLK
jgi:hypothetical protein